LFRFVPGTGKQSFLFAKSRKEFCTQTPVVILLIILTVKANLLMELIMKQINKGKQCVNSLKYNILYEKNDFHIYLYYANFLLGPGVA
jgi:hypothetical protein